ncbi:hypothetical protein FRACYDRAFT_238278 [Fragilariopsis cylindrus CCMP1102]|uniref:Uncharacterized protein n=1 Tax=Fragilariopsis cylindrus CCMP1102 TaxID=635003 RepID=A0A1E7FI54_9STRA|nr:hypothetical protein FRACYDRAFT_238278 [Fragilariopsis cylindrus CCMP1102]|eukprot:OEU17850.1 hypothetical protein FRACYDRAFT_238278 [Fragilariopsis cylindrus CCMP1102]
MSEATEDNYKQRIEHAARYLLFDEQLCAVPSQRLTLKGALLKVGFSQEEINNNKHRHGVDRAKRRLTSSLHGSLPSLVNIASPGALSAITDTDTATATTPAVTTKKKRKRKTRRTVSQLMSDHCEARKAKEKEEMSYFEAVEEYKSQRSLPKKQRRSAQKIQGIEDSAPCRGRKGVVKGELRDAILSGLRSYIALENANQSTMPNQQKLIKVLDKVVEQLGIKHPDKLFGRMKRDIANEIAVTTTNTTMEKRRLVWSTYNNINIWFEQMKKELIELGFARAVTTEDVDMVGELVFHPGQLDRILNIDESEVSTDGTSKLTGGRPVTEYCSRESSISGAEGSNKSGYSATFIGGSTMSGYPVPPHFQVRSLAQTEQNRKLDADLFKDMRKIRGQFGFDRVKEFGVTAGCNIKAGMDVVDKVLIRPDLSGPDLVVVGLKLGLDLDRVIALVARLLSILIVVELCKYVENCIVPLYPDAEDVAGKRVLLIVDSGPGRIQVEMLARLKLKGIYLKPGVPNTTHITQPTDQNYGLFKSIYRSNLKLLTKHTTTIKHTSIPLMVFGGDFKDEDGAVLCHLQSAFDEAFSFDRNQEVWRKLGFNPFTRACLLDAKVKHEVVVLADGTIDLEGDPLSHLLMKYEQENKAAVAKINQYGGSGNYLLKEAPRLSAQRKKIAVTAPMSRERQDLLGKSKRKKRSEDIIVLSKQKNEHEHYAALNDKAKELIVQKRVKGINVYTHESLHDRGVITNEQLKILIEDHTGKKASSKDNNKLGLVQLWLDVRDKKAFVPKEWTPSDNLNLERLET